MSKVRLTDKDKICITSSIFNALGVVRIMNGMMENGEKLPKKDFVDLERSLQKNFFHIFDMLEITNTQSFIGCLMVSDDKMLENEDEDNKGDE